MTILDFIGNLISSSKKGKKDEPLIGSQRSLSETSVLSRQYNLEIEDRPIRSPRLARELMEMRQYCYEVYHSLAMAVEDCFSSGDGDDQGWTISDTQDDNETPVNPEVQAIALDLIQRTFDDEYVIGGDRLRYALEEVLIYGDCFLELGIDRDGISPEYHVTKTLYLPTWDCFRKETDQGILEAFEQRRFLNSHDTETRLFNPEKIVHFRHKRNKTYGRSLFFPSIPYWSKLKEAMEKLSIAEDQTLSAVIHEFEGTSWTEQKVRSYQQKIKQQRESQRQILDYFASGVKLSRLAGEPPDLGELRQDVLFWQRKMIPAGIPDYYFATGQAGATKEISREPSRRYARLRNNWCSLLTKGIKKVIDLEIKLVKGVDWYEENARNQYRIVWPEWSIDQQGNSDPNAGEQGDNEEESDAQGIEDLDQ
jgi:hypothetical protein